MKNYLCIPSAIYDQLDTQRIKLLSSDFDNQLKKYFGSICTEVVRKNKIDAIEVYVMGKPKYSGFENEIKEEIITLIKAADVSAGHVEVHIKMNYSAFNPNFNPSNDDKVIGKDIATDNKTAKEKKHDVPSEYDYEKLSYNYQAEEPRYSFEQVILPATTREQIEHAIGILEVE